MPPNPPDVTALLLAHGRGDDTATAELAVRVADELRRVAANLLQGERAGHTLQPTALVNEAWLRLIDVTLVGATDRSRFLALASRTMRRVLIDHARRRQAERRGGGAWHRVTLHSELVTTGRPDVDLVALNDALERLAVLDERAARVVELRFFGGLTVAECAESLGVSSGTVDNDWYAARIWLTRELAEGRDG